MHRSNFFDSNQQRDSMYRREDIRPTYGVYQHHDTYQEFDRDSQRIWKGTSREQSNTIPYSRQNRNNNENEPYKLDFPYDSNNTQNVRTRESSCIYRYQSISDNKYRQTNWSQGDHIEKRNNSSLYRGEPLEDYRTTRISSRDSDLHEKVASHDTRIKESINKERNVSTATSNMIEVAPGQYLRLRGADETWNAIKDDFYVPCVCFACDLTLFCIQDASYVLCPQCQVVNPLEGQQCESDGGVGLGFTIEKLSKWQNEIILKRQVQAIANGR